MDWASEDYTRIYGDTIFVPPSTAYDGISLLDEANRGEDPNTDEPPAVPIQPYEGWQRPGLTAAPWRWPSAGSSRSACPAPRPGRRERFQGGVRSGLEGFNGEDPRGGGAPGLRPVYRVAWDERPGESEFSCRECSGAYSGCLHCGDPRAGITEWSSWRHPRGAEPSCAEYQELLPPQEKRPYTGGPAPSQTYAIGGPWKAVPPKAFRLPSVATVDGHCQYPDGWAPETPGRLPKPAFETSSPPEPFTGRQPGDCCDCCPRYAPKPPSALLEVAPVAVLVLIMVLLVICSLLLSAAKKVARGIDRAQAMVLGKAYGVAETLKGLQKPGAPPSASASASAPSQ